MRKTSLPAFLLGLTLAVCASLATAAPAGAQDAARFERAKSRLPPDAAREFEELVIAARARGLPTEPLVNKALEGLAKGVAPDRILGVVRSVVDQLAQAQTLLSVGSRPAATEVEIVANALRRGVPPDAARKVRADARPGEPVAQAIHTLADLLDRGVPVNAALELLSAWRNSPGGRPEELDRLPAAVERLVREGVSPAAAAKEVASAVRASREAVAGRFLPETPRRDGRGVRGEGPSAPPDTRSPRGEDHGTHRGRPAREP